MQSRNLITLFLKCTVFLGFLGELHALVPLSRSQIMSYANTAVGSRYIWGGSTWDPSRRSWGGTDCAGLVLKAWRWPRPLSYQQSIPGKITTRTMAYSSGYPWSKSTQLSSALRGDIGFFRTKSGGHVYLVNSSGPGYFTTVEARGKSYGVVHHKRSWSWLSGQSSKILKRHNMSSGVTASRSQSKTSSSKISLKKIFSKKERVQETTRNASSRTKYHTVKSGETLRSLSRKYKLSVLHLKKINNKKALEQWTLKKGQRIRVS